jgi:hypothetical protein
VSSSASKLPAKTDSVREIHPEIQITHHLRHQPPATTMTMTTMVELP